VPQDRAEQERHRTTLRFCSCIAAALPVTCAPSLLRQII
jgi:hypothetical protein